MERIRELTKTNKNGTTAYNIVEACKQIGFSSKGIKTKLSNITKENIVLPCIAHVIIDKKFKHFIVIYKIDFSKKQLLIADPVNNIKKLSFADFEKIFDGILIILYPIKKLPFEKNISLTEFIISVIKMHRTLLLNIVILSVFVTMFSIISSFYIKYVLDGLSNVNNLLLIFLFFLFINLFKILSDFFRNKILIYLNQKIDLNLTIETFKKIISLPYNYYHSRTTGDIISRINDLSNVRNMVTKVSLSLFIDLPLAFITFIIFCFINIKLSLISITIIILYLLIIMIFKNTINNNINNIQIKKSETMTNMIESISSFETVKGISNEEKINTTFENKYVNLLKNTFKFDNINNIIYILKELINTIGYLVIIFIGSKMVISNEITIGSLLVFINLSNYFLEPMKTIIDLNSEIKEAKNSLKRILEIFVEEKELGFLEDIKANNINFKNLNYSYDDKKYVLKNINLKLTKGKILILGESGSGKSTLFKLLMKYYDVPKNKIIIDNNDINTYKKSAIKNNISYISQNENLYTDSVFNNLKINNKITNEEIIKISKLCYIDEFLNELGLNMLIEENGYNLSGGQRQRIILARALLKKFKILIIDEGLSQMDINLERKILKNIFDIYKNKMIIVISHRLDNMDLYDRVIELKNGQVIKDVYKNG